MKLRGRPSGPAPIFSILTLGIVVACAEADPAGPPGQFDAELAPNPARAQEILDATRAGQPMMGSDDMHSYLNAIAPGGVGGVFQTPDGMLNVYLEDLSRSSEAITQLVGTQKPDRNGQLRFPPGMIRTIQGQYDWDELRGWYESLLRKRLPAMINAYDIDERLNRIRLVVSSEADRAAIRQVLVAEAIPEAAVVFEIAPVPVLTAGVQAQEIQDTDSPVRGGFAIQLDQGSAHCTLGFNTEFDGKRGFVTASHCTEVWGAVTPGDSARNGLAIELDDRIIGGIVKDDEFFGDEVEGCPAGEQCRFSDAAMYEYRADSMSALGIIANTVEGDRTLQVPDWSIQSDDPHCPWVPWCGIVGQQQLTKVGSATGRTTGTLTASCMVRNTESGGQVRYFLCSDQVDGTPPFVGGGDSGASVFEELHGSNVELWGLVFTGNSEDPAVATRYWLSRIRWIKTELDGFETEDPGPGGVESVAPTGSRRIGKWGGGWKER